MTEVWAASRRIKTPGGSTGEGQEDSPAQEKKAGIMVTLGTDHLQRASLVGRLVGRVGQEVSPAQYRGKS